MLRIIIPTYKSEKTIERTLRSLGSQIRKNFQVVICDDGSPEENFIKLKRIVDKFNDEDNKVFVDVIRSAANRGPAFARNMGIDYDDPCDYIMFLDADDTLSNDATEILYGEAKKYGADIISSSIQRVKNERLTTYIPNTNTTWLHGKIYSKAFLKKNDIRFPSFLKTNEDCHFNLLAFNLASYSSRLIDRALYYWHDTDDSLTHSDYYLERGRVDYITSIILALEELLKRKVMAKHLGGLLVDMYTGCQEMEICKQNGIELDALLSHLLGSQELYSKFSHYHFIKEIFENCRIGNANNLEKKFVMFPTSIEEWVGKYNVKLKNRIFKGV